MKIGNQKQKLVTVPKNRIVRLALTIEKEDDATSNTKRQQRSSSSSKSPPNKKQRTVFKYPLSMTIDVVGPCLKKEDKANHTVSFMVGSTDVLYSYDFDLSPYVFKQGQIDDKDELDSDELDELFDVGDVESGEDVEGGEDVDEEI